MATPRYAHCLVHDIRSEVQDRLQMPAPYGQNEAAEAFWARVAKAGRLVEALELYDQIAAEWAAGAQVRRETKAMFFERVEREGRRAEAERVVAELLADGLTHREAQDELVERFQPLDGSETRAWSTPDPWEAGRLFGRRADQKELVARADGQDEEDVEQEEVEGRVAWARFRQKERLALAEARRRARELKAAAQQTEAVAPVT